MLPTHAMQRAMERCPGICPGVLIRKIHYAVLAHDDSVARFLAHVRHEPFLGIYHFNLPDGAARYALATIPTGFVVTFLEPGREVWIERGLVVLGETGLEKIA